MVPETTDGEASAGWLQCPVFVRDVVVGSDANGLTKSAKCVGSIPSVALVCVMSMGESQPGKVRPSSISTVATMSYQESGSEHHEDGPPACVRVVECCDGVGGDVAHGDEGVLAVSAADQRHRAVGQRRLAYDDEDEPVHEHVELQHGPVHAVGAEPFLADPSGLAWSKGMWWSG
ncbi:MAG: hypothetical protein WKF82_05255 [Nocardioidaceae bacterium]